MDDCTSLGNTHAKHRYTALEADNLVMDPLDDSFIDHVWNLTAETNTIIYRNVFHCVPDDSGKKKKREEFGHMAEIETHGRSFIFLGVWLQC
jgi:hypothetical protein